MRKTYADSNFNPQLLTISRINFAKSQEKFTENFTENDETLQKKFIENAESSQKIIEFIREDGYITTQKMADLLGILRRAVAKHIEKIPGTFAMIWSATCFFNQKILNFIHKRFHVIVTT